MSVYIQFIKGLTGLLFAEAVYERSFSINFTLEEDSSYKHNFTENLSTFVEGDLLFEIVDEGHVMFNGERILFSSLDWISFNTTSGVMEFNSVGDNQTGFLEIPVFLTK